jgi:hypothetical protein
MFSVMLWITTSLYRWQIESVPSTCMFCTLPHCSKEVYTVYTRDLWTISYYIWPSSAGIELREMFLTGLPSSIIGAGTTHHVRTFTTKHADQFLITNVVISDTPDGHIFTEICPQLQWCLWIFLYLSIHGLMVKVRVTLSCTVSIYFCLHTDGIN